MEMSAPIQGPDGYKRRPTNRALKMSRVLLVDDHPLFRTGIRGCLADFKNLVVIGEAADGLEALRLARELSPDLVLMDIDLPGMNGLAATEWICKKLPKVKVLILSMHNRPEYVARAIQSGARGFLLKDCPRDELVKAIEFIERGEPFFSAQAAWHALTHFPQVTQSSQKASELSRREEEVLIHLVTGRGNREIAEQLNISVRTVESHRAHLMEKLEIFTIAGLTKYALTRGLISLDQPPFHPAGLDIQPSAPDSPSV